MSVLKKRVIFVMALSVAIFGAEIGERLSNGQMPGFIQSAEAIVGRPLTPVSVAGVARRTVRRCAVGVYHC